MKKKTKEDQIIEYLKPFLKPFDKKTADLIWKNLRYELNEGTLDSSHILFREDITEGDRKEINQMIRLYLLNDKFSDKLSKTQRELLLKLNIMDFDWPHSNKLTFDGLSDKLRFGFIPEHNNIEGGHDPDRERFNQSFFQLFAKYGKDARLSEIISNEERKIIKNYAHEGMRDIEYLSEKGIKGLRYESFRDDKKKLLTPKGIIVQTVCAHYWADRELGPDSNEYYNPLIREKFRDFFHEPNTYDWIIRDYYYLTEGFFHVSDDLIKRGAKTFYSLNIRPPIPLDDKKLRNEYIPFKDYLVELGYLSEEDMAKIEFYYFKHHDQDFIGNTKELYYFVFAIALLFKQEHKRAYNYYLRVIKSRLRDLKVIYSIFKTASQYSVNEKKSDSTIKTIFGDEYFAFHRKTMDAAHAESDEFSETNLGNMNLDDLELALNLRVRDFKTILNNNMILYCIFYFYIFDGLKLLKREMAQHRPTAAPEYLYTIIIFLRKRLLPWANSNLILSDFNYAGMSPKVKYFQKGETSKSSKAKSDSDKELDIIKDAGLPIKSTDDHRSKHRVSTIPNVIDEFIRRFSGYSLSSKEIYNKWKNSEKIHLSELEQTNPDHIVMR